MQSYQLDLTGYLCPLPLLALRRVVKEHTKPYQLTIMINHESKRDIELFCAEENIAIMEKYVEINGIKLDLFVSDI